VDYMDNVSKRIVSLREEKGETQQELANAIGITRQSLSRYEIAARTVSVEVLGALAQHFNVSADYLLGLSDVRSTEQDIQTACEVTGLSEKAIENIQNVYYHFPRAAREELAPMILNIGTHSDDEKEDFTKTVNQKSEWNEHITAKFLESEYFEKVMHCICEACASKKELDNLLNHPFFLHKKAHLQLKEAAQKAEISSDRYKVLVLDTYELIKKFVETYLDSEQEANNHAKMEQETTE
jgi:transcriptional regulator with XRE-family HTH domain